MAYFPNTYLKVLTNSTVHNYIKKLDEEFPGKQRHCRDVFDAERRIGASHRICLLAVQCSHHVWRSISNREQLVLNSLQHLFTKLNRLISCMKVRHDCYACRTNYQKYKSSERSYFLARITLQKINIIFLSRKYFLSACTKTLLNIWCVTINRSSHYFFHFILWRHPVKRHVTPWHDKA